MNPFLPIRPGNLPGNLPGNAVSRAHVARLKAVVREELFLPEDAAVILSELRCGDESCAPVETLVAVLADGGRRVWKLGCPTQDVAPQLLRALLIDHPDGGQA